MKHATSPVWSEYTLCGEAFDIADVEPDSEVPVFARPGERVTCEVCIRIIDWCKHHKYNCCPNN